MRLSNKISVFFIPITLVKPFGRTSISLISNMKSFYVAIAALGFAAAQDYAGQPKCIVSGKPCPELPIGGPTQCNMY